MGTTETATPVARCMPYQRHNRLIFRSASSLLVGLCLHLSSVDQVIGQEKAISQPPLQQPQLSPYLDLLRRDNSLLGPYHTFVRPRQQIRGRIAAQSNSIYRLQQQAAFGSTSGVGKPRQRLATGRGGQFQNYLHFYPSSKPTVRPPRGRPGR